MSRPAETSGAVARTSFTKPSQRASHRRLISDRSTGSPRRGKIKSLDALVVPAGRRAHHLQTIARWAVECEALLVVLASHDCDVGEASAVVSKTPGCRALIVDVSPEYTLPGLPFHTSASEFQDLSAGRRSNLSLKRNLGLLLAKLMGWEKIMFLDDDVIRLTGAHFARVAAYLETRNVAGLASAWFPDNSVVCHANRLSGARQDVFVSGATLGVNVSLKPVDFFPDIYNEDWLAFASHVQGGEIVSVGHAGQLTFNPYEDPQRAAREEFGDLVAEGLFALFGDGFALDRASGRYWSEFIGARKGLIEEINQRLEDGVWTHEVVQAQRSLAAALGQLDRITPSDCLEFVSAWQHDRATFATRAEELPRLRSFAAACAYLQLGDWREAEFANANVSRGHLPNTGPIAVPTTQPTTQPTTGPPTGGFRQPALAR
jgi:hypothetical protein